MRISPIHKFCVVLSCLALTSSTGLMARHCAPPYRPMKLLSPAFKDGQRIPKMFTADGSDISPPLIFANVPKHTRKLVLICEDPDAPGGGFVHWVIFNLLGNSETMPEGLSPRRDLSDGSRQGLNSFGQVGYNGPSPPSGKSHRYYFWLYAIDQRLHLKSKSSADQVRCSIQGHILAEAKLMGTYSRP